MCYYSAPRRALRGVRQLLYPRRCPFCNAVLGSIRTCPDCAEEVDRLRRKPGIRLDASQHYLGGLSGAAAPFRYEAACGGPSCGQSIRLHHGRRWSWAWCWQSLPLAARSG